MDKHLIKKICRLITQTFQENEISIEDGIEACAMIIIFEAIASDVSKEAFKYECDEIFLRFLTYKKIREKCQKKNR